MLPTPVADSTPSTATAEGRDQRGRFVPGNRGGPGNPFARQVAGLRQAFLDSATPEDLAAIAQALLAKAKEGDLAAAKLVLSYLIGKPTAVVDPDRLDVEEWQNFKDCAPMMSESHKLVTTPVPQMPLELVRASRVGATRDISRTLGKMLQGAVQGAKAAAAKNPSPQPAPTRFSNGAGAARSPSPSANGHNGRGAKPAAAACGPTPSPNGHNGRGPEPVVVQ